jgi:Na+/melibiose symporter-like transporter
MKTAEVLAQPAQPVPTILGPKATSLDTKSRLSVLWIFYMFNAAYIDITTLYYSVFVNHKPTVHYSQVFLLGAAVLIEISIAMVLLSRVLEYRTNRRANIVTGIFLTAVQLVTLFVGTPTLAYLFFSVILIVTSVVVARCAWKWLDPESAPNNPRTALAT